MNTFLIEHACLMTRKTRMIPILSSLSSVVWSYHLLKIIKKGLRLHRGFKAGSVSELHQSEMKRVNHFLRFRGGVKTVELRTRTEKRLVLILTEGRKT